MSEEKGTVTLKGTVPVYVEVDLDDRQVLSVVVDDEHLKYDEGSNPDEYKAAQIAEDLEWPAWQFGW